MVTSNNTHLIDTLISNKKLVNTDLTASMPDRGLKPVGQNNPTRIMVVASRKTGAFRRVIDDNDDTAYAKHHEPHVHPGEVVIYMHPNDYNQYKGNAMGWHDHVARAAGFKERPHWTTTRHAVVSPRGEIMNVIEADPSCGDLGEHIAPGHTLLQHPSAERGMIVFHDQKIGGLKGRNGAGTPVTIEP
jgi:hypothetical protein